MPCSAATSTTPVLDGLLNYNWTWTVRQDQGDAITLLSVITEDSVTGIALPIQPTWLTFTAEFVPKGGTPTGGAAPGSLPTSSTASFLHVHFVVAKAAMVTGNYCVGIRHQTGTSPVQTCLFPLNVGQAFLNAVFTRGSDLWLAPLDDLETAPVSIRTIGAGPLPAQISYDPINAQLVWAENDAGTLRIYTMLPLVAQTPVELFNQSGFTAATSTILYAYGDVITFGRDAGNKPWAYSRSLGTKVEYGGSTAPHFSLTARNLEAVYAARPNTDTWAFWKWDGSTGVLSQRRLGDDEFYITFHHGLDKIFWIDVNGATDDIESLDWDDIQTGTSVPYDTGNANAVCIDLVEAPDETYVLTCQGTDLYKYPLDAAGIPVLAGETLLDSFTAGAPGWVVAVP